MPHGKAADSINKAETVMTTQMKPIRSFLFVPGNKPTWIEKSIQSGADALILDLEDSVPPAKVEAREIVRSSWAGWPSSSSASGCASTAAHLYDFDDILAIVNPVVEGIVISKPCGPEDIHTVASMLAEAEYRAGIESVIPR